MSGISGVSRVNGQNPSGHDSVYEEMNKLLSKEIKRNKDQFSDGTLRDMQIFDTVEKVARAIERGDRVASRVLIDALQMILNVRTNFEGSLDRSYQAHVDRIATKLGSALKGPLNDEKLANPWAHDRSSTQQKVSGREVASRFASELTRRGMIDASLHFI